MRYPIKPLKTCVPPLNRLFEVFNLCTGMGVLIKPPYGGVDKGVQGAQPLFVNLARFFVLLPRVIHPRAEFITARSS